MKKTVYTIAFIALFSVISNAQTSGKVQVAQPVKAETVNPDGTLAPATQALKEDNGKREEVKPAGGTRMAITEKGVPASKKPAENKKTEAPKTEKN